MHYGLERDHTFERLVRVRLDALDDCHPPPMQIFGNALQPLRMRFDVGGKQAKERRTSRIVFVLRHGARTPDHGFIPVDLPRQRITWTYSQGIAYRTRHRGTEPSRNLAVQHQTSSRSGLSALPLHRHTVSSQGRALGARLRLTASRISISW
jgi:hypothetical protein